MGLAHARLVAVQRLVRYPYGGWRLRAELALMMAPPWARGATQGLLAAGYVCWMTISAALRRVRTRTAMTATDKTTPIVPTARRAALV
jgi:hypothetical protein